MTESEALGVFIECYDDNEDKLDFEKFENLIIETANEDT